jgi:hypothetical protein
MGAPTCPVANVLLSRYSTLGAPPVRFPGDGPIPVGYNGKMADVTQLLTRIEIGRPEDRRRAAADGLRRAAAAGGRQTHAGRS